MHACRPPGVMEDKRRAMLLARIHAWIISTRMITLITMHDNMNQCLVMCRLDQYIYVHR